MDNGRSPRLFFSVLFARTSSHIPSGPDRASLARSKISATGRSSFKMQMVALIFALSAPFPFRTGNWQRAVRHGACNREIGRPRVRVVCAYDESGTTLGLNGVNFNCAALMPEAATLRSYLERDCWGIFAPRDRFVILLLV